MATELELKLSVAPASLPRLHAVLAARSGGMPPLPQVLESRYFDCRDGAGRFFLRDADAALRVRSVQGRRVQTLKTAGTLQAGMHRRSEWESEVEGEAPDLERLQRTHADDPSLAAFLADLGRQGPLRQVFATRFERTAYLIQRDASLIEAAVDRGEILAGGRRAALSELELELVRGSPAAVLDLAYELAAAIPFSIGLTSKAERGYALVGRRPLPPPVKARPPQLALAMPVDDAFAAIFLAGLGHLTANQQGFLRGRDPEYLHQMRVAIRRTRAALALFGRVVPKGAFADLSAEMAHYGRLLGEARNWDVFEGEVLPEFRAAFGAPRADTVARLAGERQASARRTARRAVREARYTRFLLGFAVFATVRRWRGNAPESALAKLALPAGEFALAAVRKRHRQLARLGAAVLGPDTRARHAARIAGKKLRYCADFFSTLFREEERQRYLEALASLQDALGRSNDLATAAALLTELRPADPTEAAAVEACREWLETSAAGLREDIAAAWRDFARLKPPRLAKRSPK